MLNQRALRVVSAFGRTVEGAPDAQQEPDSAPGKMEPKDGRYLLVYLTNSYTDENGGKHSRLDYGSSMAQAKYPRSVIEDIGFQNHGDNFQWQRVYWVFTLGDQEVVYQADVDSLGNRVAGKESISTLSGEKPKSEQGSILTVSDLERLKEFPFNGTKVNSVLLPGQESMDIKVAYLNGSPRNDGKLDPSIGSNIKGVLSKVNFDSTSEEHKILGDNYRIWDEGRGALIKPSGEPDPVSTKTVMSILNAPEEKAAEPTQGEEAPKFTPLGESGVRPPTRTIPEVGVPKPKNATAVQSPYQRVQPKSTGATPSGMHETKIDTTKEQLKSVEQQGKDLQKQHSELKKQQQQQKVQDRLNKLAQSESEVESLENQIKDNKQRQKDLKTEVTQLKRELPDIKKQEKQQDRSEEHTSELQSHSNYF